MALLNQYNNLVTGLNHGGRMYLFGATCLAVSLILKICSIASSPTGNPATEFWHIVFFMWSVLFFTTGPLKIERIKE